MEISGVIPVCSQVEISIPMWGCVLFVCVCIHLSVLVSTAREPGPPKMIAKPAFSGGSPVCIPRSRALATGQALEGGFIRGAPSCLSRAQRFIERSGGWSALELSITPANLACWPQWPLSPSVLAPLREWFSPLVTHWNYLTSFANCRWLISTPQRFWSKTWASGMLIYRGMILMSQSGLLRHVCVSESPGEAFPTLSAWLPLWEILM